MWVQLREEPSSPSWAVLVSLTCTLTDPDRPSRERTPWDNQADLSLSRKTPNKMPQDIVVCKWVLLISLSYFTLYIIFQVIAKLSYAIAM